jgi:hypothetical protein
MATIDLDSTVVESWKQESQPSYQVPDRDRNGEGGSGGCWGVLISLSMICRPQRPAGNFHQAFNRRKRIFIISSRLLIFRLGTEPGISGPL